MHTNNDLTEIHKFNYLVSLLEGTASRAMAGLPITEENYDAAVDILHKRFGTSATILSAYGRTTEDVSMFVQQTASASLSLR